MNKILVIIYMIYLQYNLDIGIPSCGKILVEYIPNIGIQHLASLFPANIWNTYKKHYSNKEVIPIPSIPISRLYCMQCSYYYELKKIYAPVLMTN
jgi:hypothetical protein